MRQPLVVSSGNFTDFAYILPYIRYCAEDRYTEPWHLERSGIPDNELILITEGSGRFGVGAKSHEVARGELIYLPPGIPNNGDTVQLPFSFLCIHFDLFVSEKKTEFESVQQLYNYRPPLEPIGFGKARLQLPEFLDIRDSPYVSSIFRRILNEVRKQPPGFNTAVQLYLIEMLISLFRQIRDDIGSDRRHSPEVEAAMAYIDRNYMRRIYLKEIANHIHLQHAYLSNLFHKQTGLCITEYVTTVRMAAAKEMLLGSARKLDDIASSTGFCDLQHFCKVFRRHEGVTPAQYRQCRGNKQ